MNVFIVLFFGLIQGLTEFLPVSSSGHLALFSKIFGVEDVLFYSVATHVGTLIPLVILFKKEIIACVKDKKMLLCLIIATIPAGVVGLVFGDFIEGLFSGTAVLPYTFTLTAIMLIIGETKTEKTKPVTLKNAVVYGVFQAFAVLPGLSRSGTCLTAGNLCKVEREKNVGFAFLMSVPIILASAFLEAIKVDFAKVNLLYAVLGLITSAVGGYFSLKLLKNKKINYVIFAVYLCILSVIITVCRI